MRCRKLAAQAGGAGTVYLGCGNGVCCTSPMQCWPISLMVCCAQKHSTSSYQARRWLRSTWWQPRPPPLPAGQPRRAGILDQERRAGRKERRRKLVSKRTCSVAQNSGGSRQPFRSSRPYPVEHVHLSTLHRLALHAAYYIIIYGGEFRNS